MIVLAGIAMADPEELSASQNLSVSFTRGIGMSRAGMFPQVACHTQIHVSSNSGLPAWTRGGTER